MPAITERLSARVEEVRKRRPVVDHAVRTVQHYNAVKGNLQAGAVTYFAFLSFFPILALGFFAIGYVSELYPDARANLEQAVRDVFPGIIGDDEGQVRLEDIQDSARTVGLIGLAGVLYAGLGWLSGMRDALLVMFEEPPAEQPGFVGGKVRDLVSLVVIGTVMVVSVAVSSVVAHFSEELLELVGLGVGLAPVLWLLTLLLGVLASTVLFFAIFQLLARPNVPVRALWTGALLGAVGFEVLKRLSSFLLSLTEGRPVFQAFGIALILVVWINYFSRVVMYAAAWALTSPLTRAEQALQREAEARKTSALSARPPAAEDRLEPATAFMLGGAAMLGAVALARRTFRRWST